MCMLTRSPLARLSGLNSDMKEHPWPTQTIFGLLQPFEACACLESPDLHHLGQSSTNSCSSSRPNAQRACHDTQHHTRRIGSSWQTEQHWPVIQALKDAASL